MQALRFSGANSGETYLGICRWAESRLDVKILTPEYEIVSVLFDASRLTPLELRGHFSGSNTSFYKLLGNLLVRGTLSAERNPSDGRSKLYRLSDQAEHSLAQQWQTYKREGRAKSYAARNPNEVIAQYTRTIRAGLKVNQFTAEFQILLHLNAAPGLSNIQVSSLVNVSSSKFNESLGSLKNRGLVVSATDPRDLRRKTYRLPQETSEILAELDRRIFAWLDTKAERFGKLEITGASRPAE